MKVICVKNGKGGDGKTVFSLNLAALLAKEGKVLLIDTDPRCHSSNFMIKNESVPVTGTFLLSTDNILHCYRFLRYTKFPHFYHRQLKKFLSCPQAMQSAGFRYCYLK